MISCEDAPGLENTLHKVLSEFRVNKVNLRKEFFKVDLEKIIESVEIHHGKIEYIAEAEALEFWGTKNMTPEEYHEWEVEFAEYVGTGEDDDE